MDKPIKFFLLFTVVFFGFLLVFNLAILKDRSLLKKEAVLDPEDPLLIKAKNKAAETLDTLFMLFPRFSQHTFLKFPYRKKDGSEIHLWAKALKLEKDHAEVKLEIPSEPENHYLPVEHIEDWLVETGNGKVRGGFTTQVIFIKEKEKGTSPENIDSLLKTFADPLD